MEAILPACGSQRRVDVFSFRCVGVGGETPEDKPVLHQETNQPIKDAGRREAVEGANKRVQGCKGTRAVHAYTATDVSILEKAACTRKKTEKKKHVEAYRNIPYVRPNKARLIA